MVVSDIILVYFIFSFFDLGKFDSFSEKIYFVLEVLFDILLELRMIKNLKRKRNFLDWLLPAPKISRKFQLSLTLSGISNLSF